LAATASLLLSSPFSSTPFPGVGQPRRIAPRHAMGRLHQPGGPHADDRRVRAGLGSTAGKAKDSSAPSPSIRGAPGHRPRAPPALPGERPRVWGAFPPRAARSSDSKGPGRRGTDAKPPTPLLGFSLSPPPRLHRIGGRSGRAATATRRAREEPEAEPEQERLRRQGRRRSWEGEKVVRVGGRSRTGAGNRTPPGTPTTPRHRRSRSGFDYTAAPK
jgi:hypothetical protein